MSPLQVPKSITWGTSPFLNVLPVEVAGWLLRGLNLEDGCWLLVLSRDVNLAAALSQREPMGTNVTLGLTDVDVQQMDMVKEKAEQVVSGVKQMCRLVRIQWGNGRAQAGRTGGFHFAIATQGVAIVKTRGGNHHPLPSYAVARPFRWQCGGGHREAVSAGHQRPDAAAAAAGY